MEYRVAELADAAGVPIDTIRFYQSRGLIPSPERRGRFAIYSTEHLERIRRIRSLLDSGFSLAQIRKLLVEGATPVESTAGSARVTAARPAAPLPRRASARSTPDPAAEHDPEDGAGSDQSLLGALAAESVGGGTVSRQELAHETGVPEALIASAVQAGLIAPIEIQGEERFPHSDLEMVRSGLEILGMGMPLDRLLELAAEHATNVDRLAEQAIDLFDDFVRKPRGEDEEAVRRVFERLLPQATQIVALHFQRVVVARALARLRGRGDAKALEVALDATRSARLEVQWR